MTIRLIVSKIFNFNNILYIVYFFYFLLILLLIAKSYEHVMDMKRLSRIGDKYQKEIIEKGVRNHSLIKDEIIKVMERYDFPKIRTHWFPTRMIEKIKPIFLRKFIFFFFHYGRLNLFLLILTILILGNSHRITFYFVKFAIVVVLLSLFIFLSNLLWHEFKLGFADIIQRSIGLHGKYWERKEYEWNWSYNQPLKDFLQIFFWSFANTFFSFILVVNGLNLIYKEAFINTNGNNVKFVDFLLYCFSNITGLGTTSILPNCLTSKLITLLANISGLIILIVLVIEFTALLNQGYKP